MRNVSRVMGLMALLMLALGATGCNNKIKDENGRLLNENAALRDQLAEMEDALQSAERQRAELAAEASRYRQENQSLQSRASQPQQNTGFEGISGVKGEFRPGEVAAVVEGDVLFDSGKVTLKAAAKASLDKLAGVLNSQYGGKTIRIEGHTDTDPIKKSEWKTNDRLACERAMAVKEYLSSKGVDGSRMYVAGWGPNKPKSSKAQSRRVEVVVMLQ
ncbi:MAG: OmpA family protein [Phycisphaerales bacterium]|nr:OmpA family protein [Phycisphaerales bacterium]